MLKAIRTIALTVTFAIGTVAPCAAQFVPHVEVSGGYFVQFQQGSTEQNMDGGGYGELAVNLNHVVGVVAFMTSSLVAVQDGQTHTAMGGLRLSGRGVARGPGHAVAFVHILGGLLGKKVGNDSFYDRAIDLGVGANISLTNQAAVRLEADYIRTFKQQNAQLGENYFRFAVGLVYGFGSR
jgi:hypothetical protein